MMKRHQHITKLQSEIIKEKKLIDEKLDEATAKHCYLEKTKYVLLPQVVIPKIPHDMKFTKPDKNPNTTIHTIPITPPNTPITRNTFLYNFNEEIDDTTILSADCN